MADPEFSECSFYIKGTDCGPDDGLLMSVLLGDIQETAELGASECGFDTYDINKHNACWIVLRNRIHINNLPRWRDTITIRTWHTGIEKFYYGREYEIFDKDRNVIGYGTSAWIIADMESHKPIIPGRTPGFDASPAQNSRMVYGEMCPKIKAPAKPERSADIIKYADYSELDHNHHVNNSRYLAWIYDALHKSGFSTSLINDFNINYLTEVKDSEKVELYVEYPEKEKIRVYGYKNDDISVFASELVYSDINI